MILVTLIYPDGSRWFAGGFPNHDAAWTWIDDEKTRAYWVLTTEIEVIDSTPPDQPNPDGFFGEPEIIEEIPPEV